MFVGTNHPNMEETGSLENPIPSGKCYLDLNRADFQAAILEVLDALPRKYFQQPVLWMTRIFHQFDDVSLMAAQGITADPC